MTPTGPIDRRTFLAELGHGALAVALVSIAGCSPTTLVSPSSGDSGASGGPEPGATPAATDPGGTGGPPAGSPPAGGIGWERVNLGFVSAYLLVRDGQAALVDTGVSGSADAIGAALPALGLDWPDVGHVILTHHHGDHVGSLATVRERAAGATPYAGAEDIPAMPAAGRPISAVGDGDSVFDLRIVTAPGHTAGSICVYDPIAGVLVAGDALRTAGGSPTMPGADFSDDMDLARQSVIKLGGLAFQTLLVGHGEPITSAASTRVAELGATG